MIEHFKVKILEHEYELTAEQMREYNDDGMTLLDRRDMLREWGHDTLMLDAELDAWIEIGMQTELTVRRAIEKRAEQKGKFAPRPERAPTEARA
jgi:hypothetical protein